MKDIRINMLENQIEYRIGFKKRTLLYSDIVQAYSRTEEVNCKAGCGVISYKTEFLYLKTQNGELAKIETSSTEKAKELLQFLGEKNSDIETLCD